MHQMGLHSNPSDTTHADTLHLVAQTARGSSLLVRLRTPLGLRGGTVGKEYLHTKTQSASFIVSFIDSDHTTHRAPEPQTTNN